MKASPCQLELFAQMMISNVEGLIQQFVSPSLPNLIIAVPNGHQQKNSVEVMFGPKKKKLMRNFSQQPRFVTVSVFVRRQNKSFVSKPRTTHAITFIALNRTNDKIKLNVD